MRINVLIGEEVRHQADHNMNMSYMIELEYVVVGQLMVTA